eukprot:10281185-Heterocapsa_arctica.AAC.1
MANGGQVVSHRLLDVSLVFGSLGLCPGLNLAKYMFLRVELALRSVGFCPGLSFKETFPGF